MASGRSNRGGGGAAGGRHQAEEVFRAGDAAGQQDLGARDRAGWYHPPRRRMRRRLRGRRPRRGDRAAAIGGVGRGMRRSWWRWSSPWSRPYASGKWLAARCPRPPECLAVSGIPGNCSGYSMWTCWACWMQTYLEFEKVLAEIEGKAEELRTMARGTARRAWMRGGRTAGPQGRRAAARPLQGLDPWQKTQVAVTPTGRIARITSTRCSGVHTAGRGPELCRRSCGDGRLRGSTTRPVVVIGHDKGHDTRIADRAQLRHGAARGLSQGDPPDGPGRPLPAAGDHAGRHARRLSRQGRRGARPGRGDRPLDRELPEDRRAGHPVIIGEGGSGGAVAFATANRVAMLEHSIYSVISPEGCASILWKDAEKMREAAEALRLTAQDLLKLGVIDRIVPGAAGRRPARQGRPRSPGSAPPSPPSSASSTAGSRPSFGKARRKKFLLEHGREVPRRVGRVLIKARPPWTCAGPGG